MFVLDLFKKFLEPWASVASKPGGFCKDGFPRTLNARYRSLCSPVLYSKICIGSSPSILGTHGCVNLPSYYFLQRIFSKKVCTKKSNTTSYTNIVCMRSLQRVLGTHGCVNLPSYYFLQRIFSKKVCTKKSYIQYNQYFCMRSIQRVLGILAWLIYRVH
jgi:hypothetical protein